MKVAHKISFTATAITGYFKLFDAMKKTKSVVNTDNIKMLHIYAFLLFRLYWNIDSLQIANSKKAVYIAF